MEVVLKNVKKGVFYDLNVNFKSNLISGIYDEENSNLLEIISMLSKIEDGEIIYDKYIYNNKSKKVPKDIRKKIGFVSRFSENQLFNPTVKKELEISSKLLGKDICIDLIIEVLQMVDLDVEVLERNSFTLSTGEKRKLAIACVLIYNPEIIIIENPFVSLDYNSKKNLYKLFKKLQNDYHKTIIFSSNDMEDIYKMADYAYILKNNKILLSGKKNIICENRNMLIENNIILPQIISFSDYVYLSKGIKLGYRDDINDLIKDIYRNVT